MPNIVIESTFNHEKNMENLINCCPSKVFGKKKGKAVVVNERDCTTCRECIKLEGVTLGKVKDHFICTAFSNLVSIESTGIFTAEDIFLRALKVLEDKAKSYIV
jgi:ferredoxin-like protein FixX